MKKRLLRHAPAVALGIGAGIAAAVLFSLAVRATFLAAALANLAPLPIMVATLGYGAFAGAAAVASATLTVAGLFGAQQKFGSLDAAALGGLVFAFSLGLPAFWLSLLAVLSRAKGSPNWVITSRVGNKNKHYSAGCKRGASASTFWNRPVRRARFTSSVLR